MEDEVRKEGSVCGCCVCSFLQNQSSEEPVFSDDCWNAADNPQLSVLSGSHFWLKTAPSSQLQVNPEGSFLFENTQQRHRGLAVTVLNCPILLLLLALQDLTPEHSLVNFLLPNFPGNWGLQQNQLKQLCFYHLCLCR